MSRFKVAGVQMDIEIGAIESNLAKMKSKLSETTARARR